MALVSTWPNKTNETVIGLTIGFKQTSESKYGIRQLRSNRNPHKSNPAEKAIQKIIPITITEPKRLPAHVSTNRTRTARAHAPPTNSQCTNGTAPTIPNDGGEGSSEGDGFGGSGSGRDDSRRGGSGDGNDGSPSSNPGNSNDTSRWRWDCVSQVHLSYFFMY